MKHELDASCRRLTNSADDKWIQKLSHKSERQSPHDTLMRRLENKVKIYVKCTVCHGVDR